MVATVQIIEKNGTAGTPTVKSGGGTVRFKNADNATVDTNNPMVIPTAGHDYSYEKWLRFRVTVAPTTSISNIRAYGDGSLFGANATAYARAVATYAAPAEATATAGYTAANSLTSGSALSLLTGTATGTGEKGSHCVMMIRVPSTATSGALTAETWTFAYDEI